jgi:hypothetical protein
MLHLKSLIFLGLRVELLYGYSESIRHVSGEFFLLKTDFIRSYSRTIIGYHTMIQSIF